MERSSSRLRAGMSRILVSAARQQCISVFGDRIVVLGIDQATNMSI